MGPLIAIAGKGGVGKTTLAACLVRSLVESGTRPVLAVDADPNSTLAPLLGLEGRPTISDARQETLEGKTETTAISKERILESKLHACVEEARGFDLVTMGRPEGAACYCYVNNLLRGALARLRANYRAVVVDNEAGMEHLSRMNTSEIDCLAVVCEPTMASARSAARVLELASRLPVRVGRRALIWNKVAPDGVPGKVRSALSEGAFDAIAHIATDADLARLAALEESVLEADPPPAAGAALLEACGFHAPAAARTAP